jgi:hypothetical protein
MSQCVSLVGAARLTDYRISWGFGPTKCAPLPPDSGQRGYLNMKNVQISDRMRDKPHEIRKTEFHFDGDCCF